MNAMTDMQNNPLPKRERPTPEMLRTMGDFVFLGLRSAHHRRMPLGQLEGAFEPPIALGQYRLFRFDEVPRAMLTWAYLSKDAEQRYVGGGALRHEDWYSGERLWIIDLIAPYRGTAASLGRWIMHPGNMPARRFRFRRVSDGSRTRKLVDVDLDRIGQISRQLTPTEV